jgi:RNA polymerase sigma-70 factor (ECF subfamily)
MEMPGAVSTNETHLIGLVADGDLHAFELLYRHYFSKLTRFLHRITWQPDLIEEIVNDTMLVVWQRAWAFDGSCQLSTWIFAIAYRTALKALRGRDEAVAFDFETAPDETALIPEEQAQRDETRDELRQALGFLPFEQRTVVCLTYFHELGYEEIAAIMNCPVNTVKTRMFHARRRLETLLANRLACEPASCPPSRCRPGFCAAAAAHRPVA